MKYPFEKQLSSSLLPYTRDRLVERAMVDVAVAVGWVNIAYISSATALGYFVDYRLFVALTSWVHYCKYM